MAKSITLILLVLLFETTLAQDAEFHGRLKASADGHHLVCEDGTPFFWLGDTGWELIHRLNRQEVEMYLKTRREQGFNVIQTVAISEMSGLTAKNAYGAFPLVGKDPEKLATSPGNDPSVPGEYDYWDHVDFVINTAAKMGMYIALLPCWGEYVIPRENNQIFETATQCYNFGNILGMRYREQKNIIWVLGGDRLPSERPGSVDLWRAMAKGIADGTNGVHSIGGKTDYSTTFMTYHCFASSSQWFQDDAWLDMNMWGSMHADYSIPRAYRQSESDWNLPNPKPTLNGEPAYEEHPVNWLEDNGEFQAYDVRQIAFWSVFAGACGHTYGCNTVWQFYDSTHAPINHARRYWWQSLQDSGAIQMKYLRALVESRPLLESTPDQTVLIKGEGSCSDHVVVSRGKSYLLAYIPTGNPITVRLGSISGDTCRAWWFNPRTGEPVLIGAIRNVGEHEFVPPGISKELPWLRIGRGCDWVLVLDDASRGFLPPGGLAGLQK